MWHILFCFLDNVAHALGWLVVVIVTSKVALGPTYFKIVRDKAFANFLQFVMKDKLKEALKNTKTDLFSSMGSLKSVNPELSKKNALSILEVMLYCYF